jgi:hypothetical protein
MGASTRDLLNPLRAEGIGNHGKMRAFQRLPSVGPTFARLDARLCWKKTATLTATVFDWSSTHCRRHRRSHYRIDARALIAHCSRAARTDGTWIRLPILTSRELKHEVGQIDLRDTDDQCVPAAGGSWPVPLVAVS